MKRYAVLGRKIAYSRSPLIHSFLASRTGIELEYGIHQTEDPETVFDLGLDGFNVTIPYKQSLLARLSAIDPLASRLGAVNTVKRTAGGWEGYNTDYAGFGALLSRAGIDVSGKPWAVLGRGGAARCVVAYLADHGASGIVVFSRSAAAGEAMEIVDAAGRNIAVPVLPYAAAGEMQPSAVVNATPLGTDPNEEDPLPEAGWERCLAAVDLVYKPFLSPFLRRAVSKGLPSADGLDMLAVQAMRAFEIWNGIELGREIEDETALMLRLKAARGVALVGMPLSGKSTVLAGVARKGKPGAAAGEPRVADADAEIERAAGKSIPEIFAAEGEEGFRAREHGVLAELTRGPHVLACGGGALTRRENLSLLKDSLIVRLEVPLEELKRRYRGAAPGSRPLLTSESDLDALYLKRLPVYRSAARAAVDAKGAERLISRWLEAR